MINRENLIKIGRAGGNTSNQETPDQIGRVGMSAYGPYISWTTIFYKIWSRVYKNVPRHYFPSRRGGGGGGSPPKYLFVYVPPNAVVIL